MDLVLKDVSVFKKSIEAISVLIDEAELVVGKDGLELKATDPSQISMIDFTLGKQAFEKFESEETRLGLDLDYLNQILSSFTFISASLTSIDSLSLDIHLCINLLNSTKSIPTKFGSMSYLSKLFLSIK